MAFGDTDLAMMLGDVFAVPVVIGVTTTSGIVGFHDLQMFGDDGHVTVVGRVRGVTLATAVTTTLTDGSTITVDGASYKVRGQPLAQGDGATSLVYLRG